jgi:CO/xanthine dehydrogenase Mo-binding subunit
MTIGDGKMGRPVDFSTQAEPLDTNYKFIGQRGLKRKDGYDKATGQALYTRDIFLPGMLVGKVMTSPYARGRILSMDTSESEKVPGVRVILRYDDDWLEGRNLRGSLPGPIWVVPDADGLGCKPIRQILGDFASFEGQPVGLSVFADNEEAADEAIRLAKVEWEELPFYLNIEEALKEDAEILRPNADSNWKEFGGTWVQGDVEKGFAESQHIIEFDARRHPYFWCCAEMPSVVVRWKENHIEVWSGEQQPYHSMQILSETLGVPMNKIIYNVPYLAAAFGGRGNPANWSQNGMTVLAALASKRSGRPCKTLYDRRQTFFGFSEDAVTGHYKVGFNDDGTIVAIDMSNIFDVHNSGLNGAQHFHENSKVPHIRNRWGSVDLNLPPAWWCRCEQTSNTLPFTLIFDKVAAYLEMDPTEVALKNDGVEGKDINWLNDFKKEHGFPVKDSLALAIESGKKAIDWDAKFHAPGAKKLPNGRLHGMAFTWTHNWEDTRGHASAGIMIENDGTVSILGTQADLGVNPWSAYCQIVADELGMDYEDVNVRPWTTETGHMLMSPDGSTALVANSLALRNAARNAKERLQEFAAGEFGNGYEAEDMVIEGKFIYPKNEPDNKRTIKDVVKEAQPMSTCGIIGAGPVYDWGWAIHGASGFAMETGRPRLTRQAHFIEVEVDPDTGHVFVSNIVNVNDVGKAISPESVETQMTGGDFAGVGRMLMEEIIWDKRTGVMLNGNLLDYKIPLMQDVGEITPIIQETALGWGAYGTCGVGESTPTVLAAMSAYAVYNATGKWITEFPITPARVIDALNA